MEADAIDEQEKTDVGEIMSEKQFAALPAEELRHAKTFTHTFKNKKKVPINWKILSDTEDVTDCKLTVKLQI